MPGPRQRLPNLVLPDFMLYDRVCGHPGAILVENALLDRAELATLMARHPDARLLICGAGRGRVETDGNLMLLPDCKDLINGIPNAGMLVFGADLRTAHISEHIDLAALDTLLGRLAGPQRHIPLLRVPGVLSRRECASLITAFRATERESSKMIRLTADGEVGLTVDAQAKRRRDWSVEEGAVLQQLSQWIQLRLLPELQFALCFQAAGMERPKIVSYNATEQGFFIRHRDNTTPDAAKRRFALSLLLNDDYEGGGLLFPEFSMTPVRGSAGEAIVFSCSLAHEVLPVTGGERFVVISFFF